MLHHVITRDNTYNNNNNYYYYGYYHRTTYALVILTKFPHVVPKCLVSNIKWHWNNITFPTIRLLTRGYCRGSCFCS